MKNVGKAADKNGGGGDVTKAEKKAAPKVTKTDWDGPDLRGATGPDENKGRY